PFSNSGTIEANTGFINLSNGGTLNDGSLFIGAGQTLLDGGTISWNGTVTSSNLVLVGGTLQANGTLNGTLSWTGGQLGNSPISLTNAAGSTLILAGGVGGAYNLGEGLVNAGTILIQSGNLQVDWGAYGTLLNLPGAVINLPADN